MLNAAACEPSQLLMFLVKESESHVVVLLLLWLLLLLLLLALLLVFSGGGGLGGCGGSRCGSANVGDQLLDVAALEGLGEEAGPVRLNLDLGGLQEGGDLLTLKKKNIVTFLLTQNKIGAFKRNKKHGRGCMNQSHRISCMSKHSFMPSRTL
jgi:hypothetical protein